MQTVVIYQYFNARYDYVWLLTVIAYFYVSIQSSWLELQQATCYLQNVYSLASFSLCSLFECDILLQLYIRSRILSKYLKITDILSFLTKISSQNALNAILILALNFKKFPGGGGGADKFSHGQIFSWIRPCSLCRKIIIASV